MYGVRNTEAGQSYYDSLIEMYASRGVDFIKCDDICDSFIYRNDSFSGWHESEMLYKAIQKSNREIVLSLSPGPAHIDRAWQYCDMLPLGKVGKGFETGERDCLFTREEQKTMMTLWCMFRSPLMIGAELTKMDDFTLSLLTNKELLVLLSEDFRGEQLRRYFFELFMKVGAAGKSSFFCNNIHSPVGSFKKLLCLINAHGCNVSTKSLVKFLMKYIR